MGDSKVLRSACMALAGLATAWEATPAMAATPETVDATVTAVLPGGASITNPHFLYVSNSSAPGPVPGNVALPDANFGPGANAAYPFTFAGDDEYFDASFLGGPVFPGSMQYMIVGLSSSGNLVGGLLPTAASAAITANSSFDSLFPPAGDEAALIAALLSPGPASDTALLDFALTLTGNSNINQYGFYGFPAGDGLPQPMTFVEFGHDGGDPANAAYGIADVTLTTEVVPEPASAGVLAAGVAGLLMRRRRS